MTGKQTTNLASINKTAVGGLPVAVPPESEQHLIVTALTRHADRTAREHQEAGKLRNLKRGLMDDLLTGRVRVTVPDDATT